MREELLKKNEELAKEIKELNAKIEAISLMEPSREKQVRMFREVQAAALKCVTTILTCGQQYGVGAQTLMRANLADARKTYDWANSMIASLNGGLRKFRQIVPAYD